MKRLLIVEDEKAIRAGLRSMVERSSVAVEEIIECRDGAEALDILETRGADAMITDIRMPRMDGIELVRRAFAGGVLPATLVVSGYDDFGYAVEMLRHGVRDYLLKPVERHKLAEALEKLDAELRAQHQQQDSKLTASQHVVRSLMLEDKPGEKDLRAIVEQYGQLLFVDPYIAVCLPRGTQLPPGCPVQYQLPDVGGHLVLLDREGRIEALEKGALAGLCAGYSAVLQGIEALPAAYRQAVAARKAAFVRGCALHHQPAADTAPKTATPPFDPEAVVQQLGALDTGGTRRALGQLLLLAQQGALSPDGFAACATRLLDLILEQYGSQIPEALHPGAFYDVLSYPTALAYYLALCDWMDNFAAGLSARYADQNQRKIRQSVDYIQQHFGPEVDMALVSNLVSMNYSQFSALFKQYTGHNFLEYLKERRLEESRRLLRETDLMVREVSERAGFKNEKHFMRVFKEGTGVSPSDYRRNSRMDNML